jgi:Type IV secretion-system coupling protein DNA-binding domain
MASDLIPYESGIPESPDEAASRQFYNWERRGRGWSVADYPVELEPKMIPIYLFEQPAAPIIDDGRRESFFGKLFGGSSQKDESIVLHNRQLNEQRELLSEALEPVYCQYLGEAFVELRLVFPKDYSVSKTVAENLLLSFSYSSSPISFEVIGNEKEIIIQLAVSREDRLQVKQQINSHLPNCVVIETEDYLEDVWINGDEEGLIVDFGLSDEFMLPLNVSGGGFDSDLLVTIVGALSNLSEGEVGIFQVLFQKTKQDWSDEILSSVGYFEKTNYFSDSPDMVSLAKQKVSRPLFAAVIRLASRSRQYERTMQIVRSLGAAFVSLSNPIGNELIPLSNEGIYENHHEQSLLNRQSYRSGMILNSIELVSLVHPPTPSVKSEKLLRESEKTKSAPRLVLHSLDRNPAFNQNTVVIGENNHQSETKEVSLSNEQRTKHVHLIGSSGSEKSTLFLNLIKQDLENRQGLCVIDPHGDLIDEVVSNVPEERLKDVVLFDPSDSEFPIGFNILQANSELEKNLLSSDLVATFRRMSTSWGDVMDSVLANAILAFVESSKGGTLFDLRRFLVEKEFRNEFLKTVKDPSVRYFWQNEFPNITGKPQSSILIRLDSFLRNKIVRNIVCQKDTKLDFRKIMDDKKILLVKLSQGLIGEENAHLLGTLIVSKLYQTALSRQDSINRPYFFLFLDEFQNFITPSMESILSGVRKYNIGLHLAHQEFRQLQSRSQEVASSVLSNCYTRICFRLGDQDAEKFAYGFSFFDSKALQNLSVGEAIARVERSEYDFNLKTSRILNVEKELANQRKQVILQNTRNLYSKPKTEVEGILFANLTRAESEPKETTQIQSKAEDQKPKTKDKSPKEKIEPVHTKIDEQPDNSHRYLQSIIKRIGESNGFVATLEKQVFGGIGKVDVALENETTKIAVEVAITNTVEYEVQNIQKCLASGFDRVVVISSDTKHLGNIKKKAEVIIAENQLSKVNYLEPEHFHLFLEKLNNESENQTNKENKVKGYKVNISYKEANQSELDAKEQAIAEIIKDAEKRRK